MTGREKPHHDPAHGAFRVNGVAVPFGVIPLDPRGACDQSSMRARPVLDAYAPNRRCARAEPTPRHSAPNPQNPQGCPSVHARAIARSLSVAERKSAIPRCAGAEPMGRASVLFSEDSQDRRTEFRDPPTVAAAIDSLAREAKQHLLSWCSGKAVRSTTPCAPSSRRSRPVAAPIQRMCAPHHSQ
jgi:hypothetical protein